MTTTFEIPASTLRAALYFAAKNDLRYYLNGVYLDLQKGRAVSTTGSGLFCGAISRVDHAGVIVPREVIETALKALGRKNEKTFLVSVTLEPTSYKCPDNVRLEVPGAIAAGACIDGKFPDYERIIPRKTSGECATYNPDLLTAARDAINAYTGQSMIGYTLEQNGNSAAVMGASACFCVVMPMRAADPADLAWLDAAPESVAVAA